MISKEINEMLTRVGRGTPAGELLRRYWLPVSVAKELTLEKPRKKIKVLGEDLVLFLDKNGQYVCLAEQCVHRGCSMYYGFIEDGGIRCPYHGWKFDASGKCLEQPFEPKDSTFKDRVFQPSYPVQKLGGLLFIYMGPQPAPLLPRWDVFVREDGIHKIQVDPVLNCNWLQAQENSLDTTHTRYLHGEMMKTKGIPGAEYYLRSIEDYEFEQFRWGVIKRRVWVGENGEKEREVGHPAVFPNMVRVPQGQWHAMQCRVPIDDTHTMIFSKLFKPTTDGTRTDPEDPAVDYLGSLLTEDGEHELTSFTSQDKMAWETQGPLYDRSQERLGVSDKGIILWRKLLQEQIEIVQNGGEPMALVRDPEENHMIEFTLSQGQAEWAKKYRVNQTT